jgi:hypothetical protein
VRVIAREWVGVWTVRDIRTLFGQRRAVLDDSSQ